MKNLVISVAAFAVALIMLAAEANAANYGWEHYPPVKTVSEKPDNRFKGSLTVEQITTAIPELSFIQEFTAESKDQRWLFRYTGRATQEVNCPIVVNVGPRPSLAEVKIAEIAAICEAYAINEWVKSMHDKASSSPSPISEPKLYY